MNLHFFEVVNAEWVLKNTIRRKLNISKVVKIATKCFLKHRLPFMYNLNIWMPKKINMMNIILSRDFALVNYEYTREHPIN
jgi:hypothetical protein